MYALYQIIHWLCSRGESATDSEVVPEKEREREKETALPSNVAVLDQLEEALALQMRQVGESWHSPSCLKGSGHRIYVYLRGGGKQKS